MENNKVRLLRADEIEARIGQVSQYGKGVNLLLYKDARCDMNILDEVYGPENWQRKHDVVNGNLFCSVGVFVNGDWVWKQDVGTESFTEKQKGEASDSFKRACVNWGIGRELYTSPRMWIAPESLTKYKQDNSGKWMCYDDFKVDQIEYEGRNIRYVRINISGKKIVEFGKPAEKRAVQPQQPQQPQKQQAQEPSPKIDKRKAIELELDMRQSGLDKNAVLQHFKIGALDEMTDRQHAILRQFWDHFIPKGGRA